MPTASAVPTRKSASPARRASPGGSKPIPIGHSITISGKTAIIDSFNPVDRTYGLRWENGVELPGSYARQTSWCPRPTPSDGAIESANKGAAVRSRLTDRIATPPNVNEPRHETSGPLWLRRIPYVRSSMSSLAYNVAAVLMLLHEQSRPDHVNNTAAYLFSALLHLMGALSLANWALRVEWARLGDITCMLVLIAIGCSFATGTYEPGKEHEAFGHFVYIAAVSGYLVFVRRAADNNGADRLTIPALAALLCSLYRYRPRIYLDPIEGLCIFALGWACKIADVRRVCPRFYWWTALFHVLTAYPLCLVGIGLRGTYAGCYLPRVFWVLGGDGAELLGFERE